MTDRGLSEPLQRVTVAAIGTVADNCSLEDEMNKIAFLDRPLAFTDIETTGLDVLTHEIIEIGLVVADQSTLAVIDELEVKVRPEQIELASPEALKVNGYRPEDWQDAVSLDEAMTMYAAKTVEAIFVAHNVTFDWSFIDMAFRMTKAKKRLDYHRLDILTMAWQKLRHSGLAKFNLNEIARFVGAPGEPMPHRALNGARNAYEVFVRLARLP
jgi:DNA polymerase III epsilon subunit-like protein